MTGGGTYSTRPTWSLSNGWVTRGQAEDSTSDRPVACAPRRGQTGRVTQRSWAAVRVEGVLPGGRSRPFVYSLASRLCLAGSVGYAVGVVVAQVDGAAES